MPLCEVRPLYFTSCHCSDKYRRQKDTWNLANYSKLPMWVSPFLRNKHAWASCCLVKSFHLFASSVLSRLAPSVTRVCILAHFVRRTKKRKRLLVVYAVQNVKDIFDAVVYIVQHLTALGTDFFLPITRWRHRSDSPEGSTPEHLLFIGHVGCVT